MEVWSFDTDLEGWLKLTNGGASCTIAWSSATGNPTLGSVQFDATSGSGLIGEIVLQLSSATNFSDRTLSAWVLLATSGSVSANFIAATTLTTTAYGDVVALTPGAWTCVTFDPDSPVSAPGGYDATQIRWIGIQFSGHAPFRTYVDEVSY